MGLLFYTSSKCFQHSHSCAGSKKLEHYPDNDPKERKKKKKNR